MEGTPSTPPSPAAVRLQPTQPGAVVAGGARGVDKPEGIRREPQAYEDDEGEVRSERSGPQSLTRAPPATTAPGVSRTTTVTITTTTANNNNNNNNNNTPQAARTPIATTLALNSLSSSSRFTATLSIAASFTCP
ncbi:hypothetical protein LMG3431_05634 [Achromobacter pestifer]|uniref:Uncharacterized protein n=1 Tax=Achromobacter pestifer TaxID=1353889 RepID=A0A6S7B9Z1_9BURK|nr:hypothetical protein LMG3431_05634 [Achromobacter pestifer]